MNMLYMPTRGLIVGWMKTILGRTASQREKLLYPTSNDDQKVMHLNPRCGGMADAQVFYIPNEVVSAIRWCGTCAGYGKNIRMPSYCPCCDENLNQPYNTSEGVVTLERYALHVASCVHDPHSGVPIPANNPTSRRHQDHQNEFSRECEKFEAMQHQRKAVGAAPRMTTPNWASYMFGRLPIWMHKYPDLG